MPSNLEKSSAILNMADVRSHLHQNIATSEEQGDSLFEKLLRYISLTLVIITLPFSLFFVTKVVAEFERAVIFRLGRLRKGGARGPGVFFVLPCIDDFARVDLRVMTYDIPPQEILTIDSLTIKIDAVIYYRMDDALKAIIQVGNYSHSTKLLAQSTLRNVCGTKTLTEILAGKDELSQMMQTTFDAATFPWGVKVERVEIKDVRLPQSLQRAMAAEAEATREASAKIVAAEGELRASQALKDASDVISSSPAALQLRYLQTLADISAEHNSTIIFPFPIQLFNSSIMSRTIARINVTEEPKLGNAMEIENI